MDIPLKILLQSFAEGLNCFEATTVKDALATDTFSKGLQEKLISILSHYGSRVCPSPTLLKMGAYRTPFKGALLNVKAKLPMGVKDSLIGCLIYLY